MAELNIDSMLVENANVIQTEEKLVSFQNGCICCTLREDLLQEVAKLAKAGQFDYLVIETTGISEPLQVAETFTFDLAGIDPTISVGAIELKELSVLDTCVTVVDCSSFETYFESKQIASEMFDDVDQADDRSIFQLMCDQIEFSNVILLNKCDLVPEKVKNEILIATEKGVYGYNESKDIFVANPFYQNLLGEQSLRYLKEDKEGNIWFIHEKQLGVVDMSSKTPRIIYIPELNNKLLSGFELVYPVDESNIFVAGESGLFNLNYKKYKKNNYELQVHIREVRITGDNTDSLLFGGYFSGINEKQAQNKNNRPEVARKWQLIHFEFSSALFGLQKNLEYSYRLNGLENNWSKWTNKTEKEYTNLPPGSYVFEIKVRDNLGEESQVDSFAFYVLPPWYRSAWAYGLYFAIFIIIILLMKNIIKIVLIVKILIIRFILKI